MGAHSKPSKLARFAAVTGVAAVAAAATQASAFAATPTELAAPAIDWDPIIQCESGGDPKATNGSHFGLLQFDLRTWESVGDPMDASPAEQMMRANKLLAQRGTQPWDASRGCWASKVGSTTAASKTEATKPPVAKKATAAPKHASGKEAPKHAAPSAAPRHAAPDEAAAAVTHGTYTVRSGDTLSGIAAVRHEDWHTMYDANRSTVGGNPDLIFPGQVLTV